MGELVILIRHAVKVKPKPAVYISGGLDSTIVLHHLVEKCTEPIHTYTAKFGNDDDVSHAAKVAEHYNTIHKEVLIKDFVKSLPEILNSFDRPRYNVWPYYLAKIAKKDNCENVYLGEGCDELFGGYKHMDYLLGWANHIAYICPTHEYIHRKFDLNVEMPFKNLDWENMRRFYKPNKEMLRIVYGGMLPDFVINGKKEPPTFVKWGNLWNRELAQYIPGYIPKTEEDIKKALQYLVAKAWIEVFEKRTSKKTKKI